MTATVIARRSAVMGSGDERRRRPRRLGSDNAELSTVLPEMISACVVRKVSKLMEEFLCPGPGGGSGLGVITTSAEAVYVGFWTRQMAAAAGPATKTQTASTVSQCRRAERNNRNRGLAPGRSSGASA